MSRFVYMSHASASFAAPLRLQSGANWLLNRALVDTGIVAKAAGDGIRQVASAVRTGTPLVTRETLSQIPSNVRSLAKGRREGLDYLDGLANQRGLMKAQQRSDNAVNAMKRNVSNVNPKEAYNLARKEVDFLPDSATDGRVKYNLPELLKNIDMRRYPQG